MTTDEFMDLVCLYANYKKASQYGKSNEIFTKIEKIISKVKLPKE